MIFDTNFLEERILMEKIGKNSVTDCVTGQVF